LTWTNLLATAKTFFDTIYLGIAATAAAATKLATARNIDGQAFDGTADITVIAPGTHAAPSKTTPISADAFPLVDSAASNTLAQVTYGNLSATIQASFDTRYLQLTGGTVTGNVLLVGGGSTIALNISSLGTNFPWNLNGRWRC
jgi:hypothetical protein